MAEDKYATIIKIAGDWALESAARDRDEADETENPAVPDFDDLIMKKFDIFFTYLKDYFQIL